MVTIMSFRPSIPFVLILLGTCAEFTPQQSSPPRDQIMTVAGKVTSDGTAISGAEVTLAMTDATPPILHVRNTDSHGLFRFEFLVSRPTVPYRLTVKKKGFATVTTEGAWPALGSSAENPAPIVHQVKLLPIS